MKIHFSYKSTGSKQKKSRFSLSLEAKLNTGLVTLWALLASSDFSELSQLVEPIKPWFF